MMNNENTKNLLALSVRSNVEPPRKISLSVSSDTEPPRKISLSVCSTDGRTKKEVGADERA